VSCSIDVGVAQYCIVLFSSFYKHFLIFRKAVWIARNHWVYHDYILLCLACGRVCCVSVDCVAAYFSRSKIKSQVTSSNIQAASIYFYVHTVHID